MLRAQRARNDTQSFCGTDETIARECERREGEQRRKGKSREGMAVNSQRRMLFVPDKQGNDREDDCGRRREVKKRCLRLDVLKRRHAR